MIELGGIIVLGILAQWIAWRLKVPAILPLILTGLVVGPISTLFTEHGQKLIEPIYNGHHGLFPGESLFYFVALSIGIILFEGGLTLKLKEIKEVGPSIMKLITLGSIITFVGSGIAAHLLFNLSWSISFLFAGLIIVTGPTVIAPILRNTPLNKNVATVLKWEGILIDPIGALVAVLVFEFIISGGHGSFTSVALIEFLKILIVGFALGFASAYLLYYLLKSNLIPHYLLNVFVLSMVLLVFMASDMMAHESGLLSVVVMGMVLANLDVPNLNEILYFKESLSVLLISILFILLSASINISDLLLIFQWESIALFAIVVLILRPFGVFASTVGSSLTTSEKLFIGWVGPRGIVAAGVSSLFGLKLTMNGVVGAEYITPLVFMMVLGTVLLNATTARAVAKLLGVSRDESDGIMIVGANKPARVIGKYLTDKGRSVILVDNNKNNIDTAASNGVPALQANIYSDDLVESLDLIDMGYMMAMTGSGTVNKFALEKHGSEFGELGKHRLLSPDEIRDSSKPITDGLFSPVADYINLSEIVREFPTVHEYEIPEGTDYITLITDVHKNKYAMPLFVIDSDEKLHIVPSNYEELSIDDPVKIVYLGKEMNMDESDHINTPVTTESVAD